MNRSLAAIAILLLSSVASAEERRTISLTNPEPAALIQQNPHPQQPTPYQTTVTASVAGATLRIRFDCTDPNRSRIAVHTMQHDADMTGDDTVAIVLDPFGDRRSGYYFAVNAAGARAEGLISGRSGVSLDWDGVWDADVQRTELGWTAEMRIPIATLRFPTAAVSFGFNAERQVPRDNTILRFSSPTLDSNLSDLSRAGVLEGTDQLHRGRGTSVTLNGVTRSDHDYTTTGSSTVHGTGGLDAGYEPTPGVSGTLTVHTDFAETEVDSRQINLTRFPLFFPEKRRFFSEGANQFEFGYGLGTRFIPFYSRRIGLVSGEVVPVEVGGKLLSRSGRWGLAALGVRTGDSSVAPATTLFAARGTFDVDNHLRIGGLVTRGDPQGTGGHSLEGIDAIWSTPTFLKDRNLIVAAWGAHSTGTRASGNGWGAAVAYPNDRWNATLSYDVFGETLDPSLGFLPRPGTRQANAGTNFEPRPGGDGWIRKFLFQLYGVRTSNPSGQTESSEIFVTPFGFRTRDGARLELNASSRYERLDAPFPITDRATVDPGQYHFNIADVQLESPPGRPLHSSAIVAWGTFYSGRIRELIGSTTWSHPSAKVQFEVDVEVDSGTLPNGSFTQRLYQLKAVYALSPRWILSSYTQFDSESHAIGMNNRLMNNRLRWMLRPNADLFLVWNRGWVESPLTATSQFRPSDQQLVAKLRWIFQ